MSTHHTISLRWLLPSIFLISMIFLGVQSYLITLPSIAENFKEYNEIVNLSIIMSATIALFIFLLLEIIFRRYFLKKLYTLQEAADKVARGEYGFHLPHSRFREISSIISSFNRMAYHLENDLHIIAKNAQFYHSVFSALDEGILILQNNIIIDCNDEALRIFETTRDKIVQSPLITPARILECKNSTFETGIEKALSGTPFSQECALILGEGNEISKITEITYSLLNFENSTFILIIRDITAKNEQERIFRLNARQAQMGEMISMIAHQWRQPLAVINTISAQIRIKSLLSDQVDDELLQELTKIENQVQHLSHTISDFRDFFRPDKQRDSIHLSKLTLNAIDLIDHTLKNRGIVVEYHSLSDPAISTYRNEVLQVLLTLMKNSIDAFIENSIKDAKITISTDEDEMYGIIRIKDNAGGIKSEVREKLFLPYVTTKTLQDGTGLGLYMSKIVIEEHCHGKIVVDSLEDTTEFTLLLPLHDKEA